MLLSNLNLLATAPGGVARLRELILTLAVQGKLVPQDPSDEPASELLQRVTANAPARSAKGLKASGDSDEVAKPYELPDGWAWRRLGEIVENMGSGWSPACDDGERSDPTQWAVLRTTAVQVNEYRAREHKVIPLKLSPRPDIEVKDGDILITRAGPMNRVGISCWVSNTPPRLMLSDKIVRFHSIADEMLPAFIVLALNAGWTKSQIESAKTGMAASQVNISQSDLRALWLPICSKAEQSRIVIRVEELMRLCDALEAKGQLEATQHGQLVSTLLATLTDSETPEQLTDNWHRIATHFDLLLDRSEAVDALEQTILQLAVRGLLVPQDPQDEPASKLLGRIQRARTAKRKITKPDDEILNAVPHVLPNGWEWAAVDQVSADSDTAITDGPFGANLKTEHYVGASGFRVIRLQNIGEGTFRKEHHAYIDQARFERLSKHQIFAGDIVVAGLVDESIRCCIVPPDVGPAIVKADCYRFSVHESLITEYICLYLSSNFAHEFASIHHHGLTLTRIGLGNFRSIPVPIPPAAEQSRIVTRVTHLRRLCADLRQSLSASQSTQAHLAEALVVMQ